MQPGTHSPRRPPAGLNRQLVGGLILLVVVYLATAWVVKRNRNPMQMSVLAATMMDMSTMRPAPGAVPVLTEPAQHGPFEAAVRVTGTVVAFNDEEVYPRVTGWIRALPVYAGDRVVPGQLLARLDATELGSRVNEAAYGRLAAGQMREQARAEQTAARAMQAEAEAEREAAGGGVTLAEAEVAASAGGVLESRRTLNAARAMVQEATSELEGARRSVVIARSELSAREHERAGAQAEREEAQAMVAEAQREAESMEAEVTYWRSNLKRSETLLKTGAISQQELDRDRADASSAEARRQRALEIVRQKQALVRRAESMVRREAAEIDAQRAEVEKMGSEVQRAQARLERARAEAQAMEARVEQAQASAQGAQARQVQMRAMASKGDAAVRRAVAGVEVARRRHHSAAAQELQMQAAATTALVVKGYTELRANVGGVVTERRVSPGVLVNPGTSLLRIAQIDRVRLQASVADQDVAHMVVGNEVRVHSPRDPELVIRSRVTAIFPAADPSARTVIVEAVTPNPDRRFLPGQAVAMEIVTQRLDHAVTVANRALVEVAPVKTGLFHTERNPAVWIVSLRKGTGVTEYYCVMHPEVVAGKPGNCPKCGMTLQPRTKGGERTVRLVTVRTGPTDGRRTVVLSPLTGDEAVVVAGHARLRDGEAITIGEPSPPSRQPAAGHEGHGAMKAPSPAPRDRSEGMKTPGHGSHGM